MRGDVRALFKASIRVAREFPMLHVRAKLRQNVRDMFLAHCNVNDADKIAALVKTGHEDLQTLRAIAGQDKCFYDLISRKSRPV